MRRAFPAVLLVALATACTTDDDASDDIIDTDAGDTDPADDTDPGDDTDPATACTVTPPATWSAPDWDTNAATALALRGQLDALAVTLMRDAETGDATVDAVADLTALYEAGAPSLADVAADPIDALMADAFGEFVDLIAAGEQDLVSDLGEFVPGEHGGIFGSSDRGIHEGGIEIRQLVDKGLFGGGVLYPWALALTEGDIDAGTIDAIAAAWGADATLDPAGEKTDSATYTFRMGFFGDVADALIAAKAYADDDACTAERDEALVTAFRTWELGLMARFAFYANAPIERLSAPNGDDDIADGLHALSEGLGLALGFLGMADPTSGPLAGAGRVVTDAQIADMLGLLGIDVDADLGDATTGDFVTDPSGYADAVEDVEDILADVYGLDADDLAAFRSPTEG